MSQGNPFFLAEFSAPPHHHCSPLLRCTDGKCQTKMLPKRSRQQERQRKRQSVPSAKAFCHGRLKAHLLFATVLWAVHHTYERRSDAYGLHTFLECRVLNVLKLATTPWPRSALGDSLHHERSTKPPKGLKASRLSSKVVLCPLLGWVRANPP